MPRPRFDKLPQERREQILEIAAKEFATHGYEKASLNHVLGAAGLSKGAAYYYFDDKADLFGTVMRRFFMELVDVPPAPESADRFWDWVFEMYRRSMARFRDTPWMLGLAKATWRLPRKMWLNGPLSDVFQWATGRMKDVVDSAQRVGAVRTDLPNDVLIELILAVDEVGDRWVADHWRAGENDDEVMAISVRIWDAMRQMLQPPPPNRPLPQMSLTLALPTPSPIPAVSTPSTSNEATSEGNPAMRSTPNADAHRDKPRRKSPQPSTRTVRSRKEKC